jgi:predicted nuclease of predicted toxin-antitoxin system
MKLLFDENLSPRLPSLLADIFPDSAHVRELNLQATTDSVIWELAKQEDFIIVSKDSDFQARSLLYGFPPKFVWLRVGNCPVKTVEDLLRRNSVRIHTFGLDTEQAYLLLS